MNPPPNTLDYQVAYDNDWLMPEYDDDFYCDDDFCQTCGGEGYGYACDLEFDWVNYGEVWTVCPDCMGTGRDSR